MSTQISGAAAHSTSRPHYLRVVPDTGPITPATPCPPFCAVEHDDPEDRYHYSEFTHVGPVGVHVAIRPDDSAALALDLGCDPEFLDLDDVDLLIAALTEHRAVLAAHVSPSATRSELLAAAMHTPGGAA